MKKNIMYFLFGALIISVFLDRPTFAQSKNFSHVGFSQSAGELAFFNSNNGRIYYYNKTNGQILRIHRLNTLGNRLETIKVTSKQKMR